VVWAQFPSGYDTVVGDRAKLSRRHPLARALYAWEWLSCRAADCVLMDTREHAAYVVRTFRVDAKRVRSVWVGAETQLFAPASPPAGSTAGGTARPDGLTVLFYGQLIPLHGVETIVRAARLLRDRPIRFVLIGSGQEEARLRALLDEVPLDSLEWHAWLDYERLSEAIARADVCLGIFGCTSKAARVIPNKVFQILACDKPLVTRDSPASRELFGELPPPGVQLVPPGDPQALADALAGLLDDPSRLARQPDARLRERITPRAIGRQLLEVLESVVGSERD
jgi:glycosyltransferase involved in cell wall biosynthesis